MASATVIPIRKPEPSHDGEPPVATPKAAIGGTLVRALVPIAVGLVIAAVPVPAGLTPAAWRYFALFAAVIAGVVTEPIPAAAVGLIGVVIAGVSGLVAPDPAKAIAWALGGFSNTVIWLIFAAFMFADAYGRTGLGRRIGLVLIRRLGRRTLGLAYAIALSDLLLAPFTPSNTARSGGTIYPVAKNVPPLYDSLPGPSARKIGAYLLYTALAITCVTSSAFLTGVAPNVLALSFVTKAMNVTVSWTEWFVGFVPVAAVLFLGVPLLLYVIYPPAIKVSPEAPTWAARELAALGRMTGKEYRLIGLVVVVLGFWVAGGGVMDATMAALVGVAAMVLLGIVRWDDVLGNKAAWNVLLWFATLVTLASGLVQVKFVDWLGKALTPHVQGFSTPVTLLLVVGSFFALHYLFASLTAHTTALLPVYLTIAAGVAAAAPAVSPRIWGLTLAYTIGIMGILTPYATGPSPIYFGSGYISSKVFWLYGAILGAVFLGALLAIGVPWMMWLGY
jgi:L-tartrate/succinate antiporter